MDSPVDIAVDRAVDRAVLAIAAVGRAAVGVVAVQAAFELVASLVGWGIEWDGIICGKDGSTLVGWVDRVGWNYMR